MKNNRNITCKETSPDVSSFPKHSFELKITTKRIDDKTWDDQRTGDDLQASDWLIEHEVGAK